jgi:hypothetical protein
MKTLKTVFLDTLGRTIIGELVQTTVTKLSVKNPVIVHVVPAPDKPGQMSVQLLPLFFREFLDNKAGDIVWDFSRATLTESSSDLVLDSKLEAQYEQMFSNIVQASPTEAPIEASADEQVIKMFDEQK